MYSELYIDPLLRFYNFLSWCIQDKVVQEKNVISCTVHNMNVLQVCTCIVKALPQDLSHHLNLDLHILQLKKIATNLKRL